MADTEQQKTTAAEPAEATSIKELSLDGYKFNVDTDLLDDVEAFEYIDKIENKGQVGAIVPLITFMIGEQGLEDMKAHFTQKDAEEHAAKLKADGKPADKDYKGRFRVSKLMKVYEVIVSEFDPKG